VIRVSEFKRNGAAMSNPPNQRVVITGMGALTPLGLSANELFNGLVEGRSGLRRVDWGLPNGAVVNVGGAVVGFDPALDARIPPQEHSNRLTALALRAAFEAMDESGLDYKSWRPERAATLLGIGIGDFTSLHASADAFRAGGTMPDGLLERILCTHSTDTIARTFRTNYLSACALSACASAGHAIGNASDLIRSGVIDVAITGGVEALLTPICMATFEKLGALSTHTGEPHEASRPFDIGRCGFVLAEGAGVLVLESMSHAQRRGAHVHAELLGHAASADAFHVTAPPDNGGGMAQAMKHALRSARVAPSDVQYVNAHGTSTELNDLAETLALKHVFGEHAHRLWISSNKSMVGHTIGAAAAIETIATVYTLARGVVPPTINLHHPDPRCDLDYVPNVAREGRVRIAVKNSFGFGGQNCSLVLGAA
jgi:3-oxoacyl-[acyl-carrier-protein] synthase II